MEKGLDWSNLGLCAGANEWLLADSITKADEYARRKRWRKGSLAAAGRWPSAACWAGATDADVKEVQPNCGKKN